MIRRTGGGDQRVAPVVRVASVDSQQYAGGKPEQRARLVRAEDLGSSAIAPKFAGQREKIRRLDHEGKLTYDLDPPPIIARNLSIRCPAFLDQVLLHRQRDSVGLVQQHFVDFGKGLADVLVHSRAKNL